MSTRVDPITLEVVNNALVGVAEQMAATILRTSYSTVIREMLDYSTAVFDLQGRIIAQSCRIPIHLNSMSRSLGTTLAESFPLESWRPGDVIVTNDPYRGGQHLPDIQTFLPVFAGERMVAICGTLGHHLDVGGMRPGSYAGDATEIYQEGRGEGRTGRLVINPEGPEPRELASKTVEYPLRRGDVISLWTQGGGGYGPPAQRDPDAVQRDLREGKLRAARAEEER